MALTISGTSNGKLGNLSLSASTGDILDSANTTFFGVDQWRLTTTITATSSTTDYPLTSNLERVDTTGAGFIGTAMSESSGVFTFPSTGIWLIQFFVVGNIKINDNVGCRIERTTDNSSYDIASQTDISGDNSDLGTGAGTAFFVFDVTDVSTHKVKFRTASMSAGSQTLCSTDNSRTSMLFHRLGDT